MKDLIDCILIGGALLSIPNTLLLVRLVVRTWNEATVADLKEQLERQEELYAWRGEQLEFHRDREVATVMATKEAVQSYVDVVVGAKAGDTDLELVRINMRAMQHLARVTHIHSTDGEHYLADHEVFNV